MAVYFSWALPIQFIKIYRSNDASIVQTLMSRNEASIRDLQQRIANLSGDELYAFIIVAHKQIKEAMSQSMRTVFVGIYAVSWINKKMEKWLGEKSAADSLSQSVANNVTSEMELALLDVADVVRQYPAVMEYFQHANNETFLWTWPSWKAAMLSAKPYGRILKYSNSWSDRRDLFLRDRARGDLLLSQY